LKSLIPIIIILVFLLPGCGKKGPPVPPSQKPVPAVSDLKYSKGTTVSDGFIVYRYKRPISDSPCKNCPKLFKRVSDITNDSPGYENKNIEYREEIEKGFVYTYKVVLYTKSGAQSRDSNYIDFNF